ncbi:MAG: FAD-dependent oxidoreductase, partial [Chthoniobacterales bacterium]|nr:FAD-dependent oxidoreductase [Chthoniobacterales bacterium]
MSNKRNVIIVGGVAGGASCAARLRRLDEEAEITIYEKGDYVSFANCGLPYRIGGIIQNDAALVLTTPEEFWAKFRLDAKTKHEVISVDAHRKVVRVRNLRNGEEFEKNYTHLVLATGALAIRPPIPGLDLPGVFTVRTIPDTQRIRKWIEENKVRKAVVAGGGFIGLEMAENLKHLGLEVVVVEMAQQILPPMDAEMVRPLERHVVNNGVKLVLGQPVTEILKNGNSLLLKTKNGDHLPADIVIIALGVRPDLTLAKSA